MLITALIVILYLIVQMCFVWMLSQIYKNPSIVDVAWPIGLMVVGLIYLSANMTSPRVIIVGLLLALWALRLAGYLLFSRVSKGQVDKRYTEISHEWKINKSFGYFLHFQLQGLLIFLIAGMFSLVKAGPISTLDVFAFLMIILAVIGETTADLQLYYFKQKHSGQVCNIGWWYYSRHPNYFFDWLTWTGFMLVAIQSQYGYFSLFSWLLLYVIFTSITGPITERSSVKSRGEKYIAYQQSTAMFFPWFKKKSDYKKR